MLKWLKYPEAEPSWSASNLEILLKQMDRKTKTACLVTTALLLIIGVALPYKLSITMTPSLKHRVYWLLHNPEKIKKGDYILFYFEDIATQYRLDEKRDMMKIVGCDEGDTVSVNSEKEYFCNGTSLGVKAKDISLKGEPLVNFMPPSDGKVPPGCIFVIGQHKDSLDSRYFGYISKHRVRAKAYPIF